LLPDPIKQVEKKKSHKDQKIQQQKFNEKKFKKEKILTGPIAKLFLLVLGPFL
jgi:hypothetical protein